MKINRKKNTIRNIFWGYISKILGLIIPFILRTTIIKVFGDEYLGLNTLFTSILQVLSLSELGFGTAIVYSMYKPIAENDNQKINSLLNLYKKVYRIIGTIILIIGLIILPLVPNLISGSYPKEINIYIIYLIFLINTVISYYLFAYKSSLLLAFQRNDLESKSLTVTNLIKTTLQLIAIIFFKNFYYYLYVMIISTIINNIINLCIVNKYFPKYKPIGNIEKKEIKKIKKNVFALVCHKIGGIVLSSSDNIIISSFLGLVILTKYSNYYYIISSVEILISIFFTSIIAGLGNSFVTENSKKNTENFKNILFFNAYLTIICGTLIFALSQDFITIWVGETYKFDTIMLILFIIYFYIHTIRRTIIAFRDASGSWNDNKWQPIVSAIFNIITNIILVKVIGLYGIVISTILSMILIDIPWETQKFFKNKLKYNHQQYYFEIIKYSILLLISCTITYYLSNIININIYINIIIKLIIGLIISNISFISICHKDESFKYFIEQIKNIKKIIKK